MGGSVTDIKELVTAARNMEEQGDPHAAAEAWRHCIRTAPDHRDRRKWIISRAKNLFSSGAQLRGIALLRRQARIEPDRADARGQLALMYQRAGAPDLAVAVWQDVLERFPESPDRRWWLPSATFSHLDLGEFEIAERLSAACVAEFPGASDGHNAMSVLFERRLDWQRSLASVEQALAVCSDHQRPSLIASKARILGEAGAIPASEALLEEEMLRTPGNLRLMVASAELARQQGPTREALQRWERCLVAWPDAPEGYRGMASMLRATGDLAGAQKLLSDACARFPGQASLHQALAEACAHSRDIESARQGWRRAAHLSPYSIHRLWAQCAFLGSCGARDEAEALLAARKAKGRVLWRGRYEYAKSARELDDALSCLAVLREASPSEASLAYAEAEIRTWRQDDGDIEGAEEVLNGLVRSSPATVRARLNLARALVLKGDADAAEMVVNSVTPGDGRREHAEARIWLAARHADQRAVADRWQDLSDRFFLPALHLPAAQLTLAGRAFTPPGRGGILGVSIVRNELPRVPGFLDHHRRLGVDGFVIIDNGSDDGTAEFLASQPDVRLYVTRESFAQSHFGMRWLNQVIDMDARGWVLYADADEKLVFPGSEHRTLRDLARHLSSAGEQVVPAVMLDLFPAHGGRAGDDRHWFDPPRIRPSMNCPYIEAAGGARRRLFGTTVMLSKAPLIDAASGVRYLGSHHTTPARVSGVSAALLHDHLGYLFDDANVHRMAAEAARAEHSDHAVDRRRMLKALDGLAGGDLRGPDSVRYAGSGQLLELGLIRTTASFEADAHGERRQVPSQE